MSGKKSILDDFFGPTGECIECGKPFEEQRRDRSCGNLTMGENLLTKQGKDAPKGVEGSLLRRL